jgi:LDH2 family malate/lactate/ureidoglycolate dehydrogenase
MDNWIETFRNSKTTHESDKVLIPGDPEREMTSERMTNGIPLLDAVIEDLTAVGEELNIAFKEYLKK